MKLRSSCVAVALAAAVPLAVPTIASAANAGPTTVCDHAMLQDLTVPGNLTVPAGSSCILDLVTVQGNIEISSDAVLQVYGSRVYGNTSVSRGAVFNAGYSWFQRNIGSSYAGWVNLLADYVDGNSSFDHTGSVSICGYLVSICESYNRWLGTTNPNPRARHTQKFGNVSITNTAGYADFEGNYVSHDLSCSGNAGFNPQDYGSNVVLGSEFGQCVGM